MAAFEDRLARLLRAVARSYRAGALFGLAFALPCLVIVTAVAVGVASTTATPLNDSLFFVSLAAVVSAATAGGLLTSVLLRRHPRYGVPDATDGTGEA